MLAGGVDLGVVLLGESLVAPVVCTDQDGVPKDPATLPNFRVYGPSGLMSGGTGTLSKLDTGPVTAATNASPIVVTSAGHGLKTGTRVTLSGVLGNTAANGDFTLTRVDDDRYSLDGSAGNGAYTSGGSWHVTGLYSLTVSAAGGSGSEEGKTYHALVEWTVASDTFAGLCPFRVA